MHNALPKVLAELVDRGHGLRVIARKPWHLSRIRLSMVGGLRSQA